MKTSHASPKPLHHLAPAGQAQGAAESPLEPAAGGRMPNPAERDQTIRDLAYSFFEERGRVYGHELEDWLKAEAQVMQIEQQAQEGSPGKNGASPSQTEARASAARH
jgi:hypothetical protein